MKVIETTIPLFPPRLTQLAISHGEARVAIEVDEKGQLTEWLVTGYSMPEFADSAVDALKRWRFEPARVHGEPRTSIREVTFDFQSGQSVVIQDLTEHLESRFALADQDSTAFRVYKLKELDRIPTPTHMVAPVYPDVLAAKGVEGHVRLEFYIDTDGRVRLPAVTNGDAYELMAAAVDAVKQWQFEPPTHQGHPALVRASQDFNFAPAHKPGT